jgi:hypothetical protein
MTVPKKGTRAKGPKKPRKAKENPPASKAYDHTALGEAIPER